LLIDFNCVDNTFVAVVRVLRVTPDSEKKVAVKLSDIFVNVNNVLLLSFATFEVVLITDASILLFALIAVVYTFVDVLSVF